MEQPAKELSGKLALVTGGSKGIGKAIADVLLEAGATVVITARNQPVDDIPNHHFIKSDLTIPGETDKLVRHINDQFGTIDILINNMGGSTSPSGGYGALSDEHWGNDLQLNLLSSVRIDRAILPQMVEKISGLFTGILHNWCELYH